MTTVLRRRLSILFVILTALALLASEVSVWADAAVFDSDGFADRSEAALVDEDVRAFTDTTRGAPRGAPLGITIGW